MRGIVWSLIAVAACAGVASIFAPPASNATPRDETQPAAAEAQPPVHKATGIENRELWTKSKVVGSPEPPDPFTVTKVYPKVTFFEALEIVAMPGAKTWVVAERPGKVYALDMDPAKAEKKVILDVKHTIYGLVLHPKFQENGHLYLSEMPDPKETPEGTRIVRYTVDRTTMTADPKTAKTIFTWPNGGHNGGCLRFAPDGTLYISTGDGSGIADSLQTGQDLSTVLGKILRIDVDKEEGGKAYAIPKDNPFASTIGARGEVWAYGIRQSWKVSFDTATGDLWAGEVGQDLWVSIYLIQKGGNYGWSVSEGSHPFRPERKKGPTPILKPIVEHHHTEARSITGGFVYHGKKHESLKGAYIYGDFDTGRVWSLRYDKKAARVTEHKELAKTNLRLVAWAQDHDGEVYALNFIDGGIYQLAPTPPVAKGQPDFPRKLSQTGLFADTAKHIPQAGLIPYSVNAELWSDGATKERFIAIPGEGKIDYEAISYPQPAPGSVPGWRFPNGTVFVKTFSLETEPGKKRRLETRLFVVNVLGGTEEYGDQVWSGYTYIWNDEQTDAELADKNGVDREFTIKSAAGEKKQKWHFPSRAECNVCHTVTAKYALGVNTAQLNKEHAYSNTVSANQLATFDHIGLFTKKLPAPPEQLAKLADYKDAKASLEDRARSYLQANCSHCHRKWGGGNAEFQLLNTLPVKELGVVDAKPGQGTFDLKDPRILVPGDPARSMIYHRMTLTGLGRMPHIASNVVDEPAVKLIHDWIKGMK